MSLTAYLAAWAAADAVRRDVADCIGRLAEAAAELHSRIGEGSAGGAEATGAEAGGGGDVQKALDAEADRLFLAAAEAAPVAFYGSEEENETAVLKPEGTLALATDPLDGSSNIDTNVSIGTIFSVLPVRPEHRSDPATVFLQSGDRQLAAGFFIYGPRLLLVLSVGAGTHVFGFRPSSGEFALMIQDLRIPGEAKEFSVNASNQRHWDEAMQLYVADCQAGADGPRGRDFNMRWIASMVADAYRIFLRGGVYLYPGDRRAGYGAGRLRLVYEANPVAFLTENAGGAASDGLHPILQLVPDGLHQRTPLVFGSKEEVLTVGRYLADPGSLAERSGLYGQRPLGGI